MKELNLSLELDKLREIGSRNIFEKTRIPINRIEQILARNFTKLGSNRVAVRGSLQILEREYEVKLNAWLKEYDKFYGFGAKEQEENKNEQNEQKIIEPKEAISPSFANPRKSKIKIFELKTPKEEPKQEADSMPFFSKQEPKEEIKEEANNDSTFLLKLSKIKSKKQKTEQELNEQNKNSENSQIDSIKNDLKRTSEEIIESKNKNYWDFDKKDSKESNKIDSNKSQVDSINNSLKSSPSFETNKTDSIESKYIESNNTNLTTNENLQSDLQDDLEESESYTFTIFTGLLILIFIGIAAYINSDWLLNKFPFLKDIFNIIDSLFKDILALIGV